MLESTFEFGQLSSFLFKKIFIDVFVKFLLMDYNAYELNHKHDYLSKTVYFCQKDFSFFTTNF